MPTVSYSFMPGQTVWVIASPNMNGVMCPGVQEAIVKKVTITSNLPTITPVIMYDVAYVNAFSGSASVPEMNVFGDIDTALTAYRTDLLTP